MKRQARQVTKLAAPKRGDHVGLTISGSAGYDPESAAAMIHERFRQVGRAVASMPAEPATEQPEFCDCDSCGGPYQDEWLQLYGGHWDTCPNGQAYRDQQRAAASPTGTDSAQRSTQSCSHAMVKLPGISVLTCRVCGYQYGDENR